MTIGADFQAGLQLQASVDALSEQLRRRDRRAELLADAIIHADVPAISFLGSSAPYTAPNWGPTLGYTWFIQLMTVGPLGSGDTLAVYRGRGTQANQPQNKKNEFLGTNGAWQAWNAGRTGIKLTGGQGGLVFDGGSGSLTSATIYYVNIDAIQVRDDQLGFFLM